LARAAWIEHRQAELLACQYFHVVFTLPEEIASIAYQNKAVVYNLLFAATAETLRTIAADPKHLGAEIGFFAVLHTWGQNLMHHPHLHCVVPGGGLSPDGQRWIDCRAGFFLPVRVLSRFFRRDFLERLEHAFDTGQLQFFSPLRTKEWVAYAKAPFAGPEQVLDYVGRYTHRVAISNNRILDIENGEVTFRWKDYRDGSAQKTMILETHEFIRRFLLHVLPPGLQRIRYYGLLGNRHRAQHLARCRELLGMNPSTPTPTPTETAPMETAVSRAQTSDYRDRHEALTGVSITECPACRIGHMHTVSRLEPAKAAPPILDTS
jgi:hypothetical protein